MELRFRVATLAITLLAIALSGCSSRHVFHVDNSSHAARAHQPRSHAKKHNNSQANVKAKPARPANDKTPSTWAGELD